MLIRRVMTSLVARLVQDGELLLVDDVVQQAVVEELLTAIAEQPVFAQVGPFVSGVLLGSDLVDELFVDDRRLVELLGDLG